MTFLSYWLITLCWASIFLKLTDHDRFVLTTFHISITLIFDNYIIKQKSYIQLGRNIIRLVNDSHWNGPYARTMLPTRDSLRDGNWKAPPLPKRKWASNLRQNHYSGEKPELTCYKEDLLRTAAIEWCTESPALILRSTSDVQNWHAVGFWRFLYGTKTQKILGLQIMTLKV